MEPTATAPTAPAKLPPRLRAAIAIYGKPTDEKNKALLEHFAAGLAHAREGRHEEALAEFDWVARVAPSNPDGWHNKGTELVVLARYSEALAAFDISIKRQPDESDSWDGQATALSGLGRLEESIAAEEHALRLGAHNPDFWHNRGQAHFALGHYRQAAESYDKALAINKAHAPTWAARALANKKMARPHEEMVAVGELLKLEPQVIAWRRRQIELLTELGREDEAKAARLEMYRAFRDDPDVQFEHGERLAKRGKEEKAEGCFREAVRLAPDRREPRLELGRCLARQGKHAEALACAEDLLRSDHDDADAALLGALALAELGRLDDATTVAEIVARTQRTSKEAWALLADLGKRADRPDLIERAMRGTLAIDPRDLASHHDLAVALGRQGKTKAALATFDEALRRAPHDPELLYAKGVLVEARGNFKQARALYRLALREKPDLEKALQRKAAIDKKLGGPVNPKAGAPGAAKQERRPRGRGGGRGRPWENRHDGGRPRGGVPGEGARDGRGPSEGRAPGGRGPGRERPGGGRPRGRGPGGRRGGGGPLGGRGPGGSGKGGKGPNAQGGVARGTNKQGGQGKAHDEPEEKRWLEIERRNRSLEPDPPRRAPQRSEPDPVPAAPQTPKLSIRERRALRRAAMRGPQETATDGGHGSL